MEKRFRGLNARQRYNLQYREDRVFNSYKNRENLDYMKNLGDKARLNAFISWMNKPDEQDQENDER